MKKRIKIEVKKSKKKNMINKKNKVNNLLMNK